MRLVAKVGSRVLADDPDARIDDLAGQIAALRGLGHEVVMVSSGAIALGVRRLGLVERPREMPLLQATAAVGQLHLVQRWERALSARGLCAAQVLLTHADVADRGRFLNARHAIAALIGCGAVPVINENDTVAVEEITFGDNDRLAALVTNLCEADLLVILTDVPGVIDAAGAVVPEVADPTEVAALAGGAGTLDCSPGAGPLLARSARSGAPMPPDPASARGVNPRTLGTGGMASKVEAARVAGRFGVPVVVASGAEPDALVRLCAGERLGTRFSPPASALRSRKHWIGYALRPAGALLVDRGARDALVERQRSLLPSGIREVRGRFSAGDPVSILDPSGREFARGLSAFSSDELDRIKGRKTSEIEPILGYRLDEAVHRDDLVIL